MNTYLQRFTAVCPNNGQPINYLLKIESKETIMVEKIRAAVGRLRRGFHEDFADKLARLGGRQTMTADHHGTRIKTIRNL